MGDFLDDLKDIAKTVTDEADGIVTVYNEGKEVYDAVKGEEVEEIKTTTTTTATSTTTASGFVIDKKMMVGGVALLVGAFVLKKLLV